MSAPNMQEELRVSHLDIYHKLGVLEGKLDNLVGLESRVQNAMIDMDHRLRELERVRWKAAGIAAAVAGAVTVVLSILEVFPK